MTDLHADFDQLHRAERALADAGLAVDQLGGRAPTGGDYGAAGPLVELLLGIQADAASQVAAEASMMALAVGLAADDLGYTDSQQALDMVTIAPPAS